MLVIGIAVAVLGGIIFGQTYRDEKRWNRIHEETKLCEPLFFSSKKLVAHKLWKITCLDEKGKPHVKYVKGDQVMWYWNN